MGWGEETTEIDESRGWLLREEIPKLSFKH